MEQRGSFPPEMQAAWGKAHRHRAPQWLPTWGREVMGRLAAVPWAWGTGLICGSECSSDSDSLFALPKARVSFKLEAALVLGPVRCFWFHSWQFQAILSECFKGRWKSLFLSLLQPDFVPAGVKMWPLMLNMTVPSLHTGSKVEWHGGRS